MLNMHVVYENEAFDNIDLRFLIPAGGESRVPDLVGGSRRIKKSGVWYRSQNLASKVKLSWCSGNEVTGICVLAARFYTRECSAIPYEQGC